MQVDNWGGQGGQSFWPALGEFLSGLGFCLGWVFYLGGFLPWVGHLQIYLEPRTAFVTLENTVFLQVREQMHAACDLYNNTSVEKYYIRAYEKGHLYKALNWPFTFIFICLLSLSSIYFHCITFYNTSCNIRAQMRRVKRIFIFSFLYSLSLSFFFISSLFTFTPAWGTISSESMKRVTSASP